MTDQTASDPDFRAWGAQPGDVGAYPPDLGRYRVLRELGRGGMGLVLEAYDPSLDRRVAIKLLRSETTDGGAKRHRREAHALARLSHPNVVGVYETGTLDGQDFIAMEMVDGQSLAKWHERPRPWPEVLDVYLQAGRGLVAAHAEGLVHRDFKPANCLIDPTDRVRVADFGLAGDQGELSRREQPDGPSEAELDEPASEGAEAGEEAEAGDIPAGSPFEQRLTRPGAVLGTIPYMSPEQRHGGRLDARSDQFSFCASICEGLFGRPSLPPDSTRTSPRASKGPAPALPRVPRALRQALARGMASDPALRWPSMTELLRELERCRRPRTRWRWAAVLVGINVLLVFTLWLPDQPPGPCAGASERLRGVWNPERSAAIERALVATGRPFASSTARMVDQRLDRYAERWTRIYTEVCEAGRVHHELSPAGLERRMQCLDRRRLALDHAAEQLLDADDEVVAQAVQVATALPALEPCTDARALELVPQPPPQDARAVAAVRVDLDRARIRQEAGKYEDGLRLAESAWEHAQALEYPPLQAEAALIRGNLRQALGRYEEAADDLRAARTIALRHDHPEVAAEASTGLAFVVGVPLSEPRGALMAAESALALAQRVDPGGPREAEALLGMAQVMAKHGDDAGAEVRFTQALELLKEAPDDHPLDLVAVLDGLRGVLRRQGRLAEAEALAREAVERIEQTLGPEHPAMVHRLANLAAVLVDQEHHADAEQVLRRAIEVGERSLPPGHPALAHAHGNLGAALLYRGQPREAIVELRLALDQWKRVHDPDHDRVADIWVNLGVAARRLGELDEAEGYYRRALERYLEIYGEGHPTVGRVELNLGKVLLEQGQVDAARQRFERAVAVAEAYGGTEHPDVGKALAALGQLDYEQRRFGRARARQQQALEIFERSTAAGGSSIRVARALWALGRTELTQGQVQSARPRLEQAHRMLTELDAPPLDRARAELSLARLRWAEGQRDRAVVLAQEARARLEGAEGETARRLGDELRAWLDARR